MMILIRVHSGLIFNINNVYTEEASNECVWIVLVKFHFFKILNIWNKVFSLLVFTFLEIDNANSNPS